MLDIECYIDYYLVSFKCIDTGRYREFEMYEGQPLDRTAISKIMNNNLTVSFNGLAYDLPMITAALRGYTNEQLKCLSDELITSGKPGWLVCKNKKIFVPNKWDHIDLFNVAPGAASLKIYGGRLHSKKLQDLPIEPSANIQPSEREPMRLYCRNDLDTTEDLFNALRKQIELRIEMGKQYGVDLRSKSDAQIAEAIIKQYLEGYGVNVVKRSTEVKPFKWKLPEWVKFETDTFNNILEKVKECTFEVNDKGSVVLPKELNKAIEFYNAKYKFGIGGIHSQEKSQVIVPSDNEMLAEYDLAAMYPNIIIEQQLYPKHLTNKFLDVYTMLRDERIKAKAEIYKLKSELRLLKSKL